MVDILKMILTAHVKKHANANYDKDGWDYIVECFTDAELGELIGNADTPNEAIRRVSRTAKLYNERRREIQAEAF